MQGEMRATLAYNGAGCAAVGQKPRSQEKEKGKCFSFIQISILNWIYTNLIYKGPKHT